MPPLEVPDEFINGSDNDICFNSDPDWLSLDEIIPDLDCFPADSDFCMALQGAVTCFRHQNGMRMDETQEEQALKKVVETIVVGVYDTEERYVWLICCVSRIFLQKVRAFNGLVLQSDVFRRYNCESLYCPVKMHHIVEKLYEITRGNTFGITILVSTLNHINPVLHYTCICLVSAGINRLYSRTTPKFFQPLSPSDLISMLRKLKFSNNSIDFVTFHGYLKLISLYNSLVVYPNSETLNETYSSSMVEYFNKASSSYLDALKKWLTVAVHNVNKVMAKKTMSPSLLDLKQQILMELQYGLRDYVDETNLYSVNN